MKSLVSLAALTMALGTLAPVAALADDPVPPAATSSDATIIAPGMRFKLVDSNGRVLGELVSVRSLTIREGADRGKPQQRTQATELKKSDPRTGEEWRAFWNSVLPPSTP
jgi:hypothetical protein